MPATTIVVFEKTGALAARLSGSVNRLPARLRASSTRAEFLTALEQAPFPIAFVDTEAVGAALGELLGDADRAGAGCILVGTLPAWTTLFEARERSVLAVLPMDLQARHWTTLVEHLVQQSQERMRSTG